MKKFKYLRGLTLPRKGFVWAVFDDGRSFFFLKSSLERIIADLKPTVIFCCETNKALYRQK